MDTFDDVFSAFGGPARYAEAIGVTPVHAQTMKTRGSIPPAYWVDTVAAAERLGIHAVTLKVLAELAKAKQKPSAAVGSQSSEPARASA